MEVVADVYQHQRHTQKQSQRKKQLTQTRPFSNAERQRRYREKKKADKMNACNTISQSSDVQLQPEQPQNDVQINKRQPQSNAERQRKYRKLLREQKQQQRQKEDINAITVLSNTPHTFSIDQLQNVDQDKHTRKLHLNQQRRSSFTARQRFESLSSSSYQAQAESFERCCRLCAEEQEVTVMIFSEEAESMLLKKKLNKYLLIEVEEDDKLPKNICIKCCSTLQIVCDFIDTAIKAQEILNKHSMALEQTEELIKSKCNVKEEIDFEDDGKYTPMEISVDPLMVLQNSEDERSPPIEENCESDVQTVTHLHGVDGEDVTLKLIKKGDKILDPDFHNDSDIKPFFCRTCKQGFGTELALKNHSWIHKKEVNDKPFRCGSCRERFNSKSELVEHLKKHTSSEMCLLFGRRFRTESNLAAHTQAINSNNGRSYICKVCGRSHNTSSDLKTHSVTHISERPYKCQCLLNEKPYKCPFCDKRFASLGNCYSHKNRMHRGQRAEGKIRKRVIVSRENQPIQFRPTKTGLPSCKISPQVAVHVV